LIGLAIELARQVRESRYDRTALQRKLEPRLRHAVRFAFDRVPFYRDQLRAAGVDPSDIRSPEDLRHLPITYKEELRRAGPERTLSRGHHVESCRRITTSGSTGEPFGVYLSRHDLEVWSAGQLRGLFAAGFGPRDRLVVIGPTKWSPPGVVQRLGLYRRENLDPALPLEQLAARLRRLRPTMLWMYPEHLRILLDHVGGDVAALGGPRTVITSAGMYTGVLDGLANPPERFDFYGCAEAGRLAWECRAHRGLHVNMLEVHLEIDPGGAPTASETGDQAEGTGSVLITTLRPRAMPFLRYHLGDLARRLDGPCPCGSALPRIAPPLGRVVEPLRLPSGRLQSRHPVTFVLREHSWIGRFATAQDQTGALEITIHPLRAPSASELERLRLEVQRALHEPLPIELRLSGLQ
jgi:phenylacetate-CoA ligase